MLLNTPPGKMVVARAGAASGGRDLKGVNAPPPLNPKPWFCVFFGHDGFVTGFFCMIGLIFAWVLARFLCIV